MCVEKVQGYANISYWTRVKNVADQGVILSYELNCVLNILKYLFYWILFYIFFIKLSVSVIKEDVVILGSHTFTFKF